jgi:hypothetical protein
LCHRDLQWAPQPPPQEPLTDKEQILHPRTHKRLRRMQTRPPFDGATCTAASKSASPAQMAPSCIAAHESPGRSGSARRQQRSEKALVGDAKPPKKVKTSAQTSGCQRGAAVPAPSHGERNQSKLGRSAGGSIAPGDAITKTTKKAAAIADTEALPATTTRRVHSANGGDASALRGQIGRSAHSNAARTTRLASIPSRRRSEIEHHREIQKSTGRVSFVI